MKLVVADDEILTLQLMEKIIDWDSKDINITGLTLNGKEALEEIQKDCPDILITDIRMPEMDGLELTQWVRANNLPIRIIIVSAYGEFEYAQKALNYGVSGYLLKPIDEHELDVLIEKVMREINTEKNAQSGLQGNKKIKDVNYDDQSINNSTEDSRLIYKAKEYISVNYNTNITLEGICEYISISKNYFCYLFKKEVGVSIWDYLTRYRIEKAKQLLDEANMKNYEISYKVGYENPSYFTKTFKKITGFTPQDYRERKKNVW